MTNISRSGQMHVPGMKIAAVGLCFCSLWCLFAVGCRSGERIDPALEKLGRATGPVEPVKRDQPMPAMPARVIEATGKEHRGTILETINVPNYTYIRLQTGAKEELWAAVPANAGLRKGQPMVLVESIVMNDFPSRSLGRTFSSIIFGVVKAGEPASAGEKDSANDAGPGGKASPLPALPPGHPPINAR